MTTKLTKTETEIITNLLKETRAYIVKGRVELQTSNLRLRYAAEQKAMDRLVTRGLVEKIGYGYEFTPAGLVHMNVTPKSILMADLVAEYQYEIKRDVESTDKPSRSEWTVKVYRELYRNDAMTADEVYRLERERVFQNKILRQAEMLQLEMKLARAELLS